MKIEVTDTKVENISGTSKKTGNPFSFNKQVIHVHNGSGVYPDKAEIILKDDQTSYPVGMYSLDPSSIYVDRNGRLSINPKLVPLKDGK